MELVVPWLQHRPFDLGSWHLHRFRRTGPLEMFLLREQDGKDKYVDILRLYSPPRRRNSSAFHRPQRTLSHTFCLLCSSHPYSLSNNLPVNMRFSTFFSAASTAVASLAAPVPAGYTWTITDWSGGHYGPLYANFYVSGPQRRRAAASRSPRSR